MIVDRSGLAGNIWTEEYAGSGPVTLLLLHGLGANAAVWDRLLPFVRRDWKGPCIIPDLRGHGRSLSSGNYSFGTFAADLADCLAGLGPVAIIGHSLGGALGAFLASGWFGVDVRTVMALSVKTTWSGDELSKFQEIAERPARYFDSEEEARKRFVRAAGLDGLVALEDRVVDIGIGPTGDGKWRLAADHRTIGSTGSQVDVIIRSAIAPIRFATGVADALAPASDMLPFDPAAAVIADAGHNVHVEQPQEVWRLFCEIIGAAECESPLGSK
jgi:pimeloyl-ACP methyl ester carboxylesterase